MLPVPSKAARIVEEHLGHRRASGLVWASGAGYKNTVHIDPRQSERGFLGTLIHELFHIAIPSITEPYIVALEKYIATSLWKAGYRRITKEEEALIRRFRKGDEPK